MTPQPSTHLIPTMRIRLKPQIISVALYLTLATFLYLMIKISWQYRTLDTDTGFLRIKQDYLDNRVWLTAFFTHAFSSSFVLLAGFSQYNRTLQSKHPRLHRWFGRAYVYNILCLTGPAGLIMAWYANGGPSAQIAFIIIGTTWWGSTYFALRAAQCKQYINHQKWMNYSYALTLSAITLRLWKIILGEYTALPPMDIYRLIAWLGFMPNLLIAYTYNRWQFPKTAAHNETNQH